MNRARVRIPLVAAFSVAVLTANASAQSSIDGTHIELVGERIPVSDNLDGARWFETEWGWLIVSDEAYAAEAAEALRQAVAAFHARFGLLPQRGAIVEAKYAGLFDQIDGTLVE